MDVIECLHQVDMEIEAMLIFPGNVELEQSLLDFNTDIDTFGRVKAFPAVFRQVVESPLWRIWFGCFHGC